MWGARARRVRRPARRGARERASKDAAWRSFGDDRASSILWNMIKESIFFSFEPPPEKPSKSPRQIPKCPGASEASPGSACRVVVVCKYFRETSFLGPPDTVSRERRCVGAPRRGPHRAPGRAPPAGAPSAPQKRPKRP